MRVSSQEISKQAGEWAAKVDAGELTPEEQDKLEAWLAADVRHLGAFGRSIAVLERLDRLRAVGTDAMRAMVSTDSPVWSRRRVVLSGGAVASLAAAVLLAAVVRRDHPQQPAVIPDQNFATRIGETRTVSLSDGSVVTLNTDSRISVRYTGSLRKVQLVRGEALFNVAKNKRRPFIVVAGDTQVRAVGTTFTVRLLQKRPVQILVQEGVVEVTRRSTPNATPVRATADTQTVVPHGAPIATHPVPYSKVARNLAWQYGQIAFDNETLEEAALEFARYSDKKIVVEPAVAGLTITGLFASNDPAGFAKAAASVLNLHAEVGGEEVRISR